LGEDSKLDESMLIDLLSDSMHVSDEDSGFPFNPDVDSPDASPRAFLGLPRGAIDLLFQLTAIFICLSSSELGSLRIRAEFRENQP
jgi:hypothetical protein